MTYFWLIGWDLFEEELLAFASISNGNIFRREREIIHDYRYASVREKTGKPIMQLQRNGIGTEFLEKCSIAYSVESHGRCPE